MKIPLSIFGSLLLSLSCTLLAQNTPPISEEKIYEMYDISKPPFFPRGERAMYEFIQNNIHYPAEALENAIQGNVVLNFVIDTGGNISNINILRDIGGGCGKEARRVIESMPKWIPGEANGHPINVRYTLPVRFKLGSNIVPQPVEVPPPAEVRPASREQMLELVSASMANIFKLEQAPPRNSALNIQSVEGNKLLMVLERTFETKLSEADKKRIKRIGDLSDYLYKAQFAPFFYGGDHRTGRHAKLLTNRSDFDANADGLGKLGSIVVPKGVKVILYSKKNFKGKKVEIDATFERIIYDDLSQLGTTDRQNNKGVNWSIGTQSVKVVLPKRFPEGLE